MKITADGLYPINKAVGISKFNSGTSIVYLSGAGSGTFTLVHGEDQTPLLDGSLTVGEQYQVNHGVNIGISLLVAGLSGEVNVAVTGR